jgi:hypothetical protein
MAAGSSAPELATVVIGVFCAQDDIGKPHFRGTFYVTTSIDAITILEDTKLLTLRVYPRKDS